ncbi:MAG: Uma2 family endonuclease [Candidatus Rokuibacteriota bacterium]
MPAVTYRTRRWSRSEYERLIEQGVFGPDERLELIGGELIVREPQGDSHALGIELVDTPLREAFGPGWRIRVQLPVNLDDESRPEPDISVVQGTARQAELSAPSHPVLIVEVAQSSLPFDKTTKASLYARAGIQELWIVNLPNRLLTVYREPGPVPAAPFGWHYQAVQSLAAGEHVSPLAAPHARIAIADLLP